jgi:predicted nucleic acid-binding protein
MSGSNTPTYYWDACVYIAWVKKDFQDGVHLEHIEELIRRSRTGDVTIITSTITITEVLDFGVEGRDEFLKLFHQEQHEAFDVDIRVATKAHQYREYYRAQKSPGPTTADAIHLATAFLYQAKAFHTFDDGKKERKSGRFSLLAHNGNVAGDAISICKPVAENFVPGAPKIVQGSIFDDFPPAISN